MTNTLHRLPLRGLAAITATAAVLALGGCGDDDDDDNQTNAPAPSQSASGGSSQGSTTAGTPAQLVSAGKLVLGEVSGTTLTSIEMDNGGWEVSVAGSDGSSTDASTNTEGTEITRDPAKDDDDANDRAERQREVKAADLDFEQAAAAVLKASPGTIRELNLDTRDNSNQVVWEADVTGADGNQTSVSIDAGSGSVVSNRSDNDGDDD